MTIKKMRTAREHPAAQCAEQCSRNTIQRRNKIHKKIENIHLKFKTTTNQRNKAK